MQLNQNMSYAVRVITRIVSLMLVLPASCAGLFVAFVHNFSFYDLAYGLVDHVRHLPPSVTANEWATVMASNMSLIYWILVAMGLLASCLLMGPKALFMMDDEKAPVKNTADQTNGRG